MQTKHAIKFFCAAALLASCASTPKSSTESAKEAAIDVANAPIETLNINKVKIPVYLKKMDNPYGELSMSVTCADITEEVTGLSEFLGVDVDDPGYQADKDMTAGTLAKALIPYGGVVRFFSGATQHERDTIAAARIGTARRAYLKSKGEQMGCAYPAAPHGG